MSSHLTRIPLDHPLVRGPGSLDDQDPLHKAVMSIFANLAGPVGERRSTNDILFRVERPTDRMPCVLIQSSVPPDSVADGCDRVRIIDVSSILQLAASADYARITVDVNTVMRNNRIKSTRPVTAQELSPWLSAKFGTAVSELIVRDSTQMRRTVNGARLNVTSVVADVRVGDQTAFHRVLTGGIGRAKSYGCGLVLAQPVR